MAKTAVLPWHRRSSYEPDASARGVPQSPRWRVGLVCARMRNFLAGVLSCTKSTNRPTEESARHLVWEGASGKAGVLRVCYRSLRSPIDHSDPPGFVRGHFLSFVKALRCRGRASRTPLGGPASRTPSHNGSAPSPPLRGGIHRLATAQRASLASPKGARPIKATPVHLLDLCGCSATSGRTALAAPARQTPFRP